MKNLLMTTALFGVLAVYPAVSHAAFCNPREQACINLPCEPKEIGTSTMDFDHKNIVCCLLKNDASGYQWKSMSQSQAAGIPANYPLTNTPTVTIYDLNGFTGQTYCSFYTDGSSNVTMRVVGPWNGTSTGWMQTNFIPMPITVYNQTTYCMADTTGVFVCNSGSKSCASKRW